METRSFFSTRQVAQLLGVHPQTLRRWEREGVIPTASRRRGQRVYTMSDVNLIKARVMSTGAVKEEPVR